MEYRNHNIGAATHITSSTYARKQRRISRACDSCHERSKRCRPSQEDPRICQHCADFDVECTFVRPLKKRGPKKVSQAQSLHHESPGEHANLLLQLKTPRAHRGSEGSSSLTVPDGSPYNIVMFSGLSNEHRKLVLENAAKIQDLITVYFEVVYPIFPLFHRASLLRKVQSRQYLEDKACFAMVMAICALASARARDGALYLDRWNVNHFQQPPSEDFSAAAISVLPSNWSKMKGLDWMRTCAVLALVGIQVGNIDMMHQYLGMYHTLCAISGGAHDERNWPKTIDRVEVEERRRLFWSMYTLEVYSAIVWGGVIRCRESQCRVQYPSEIDDDDLYPRFDGDETQMNDNTDFSITSRPAVVDISSWIHGWNFTTQLYRILEHAMNEFHRRRPHEVGPFSPSDLYQRTTPSQSVILEKVFLMYANLPDRFKETRSVGDAKEDRYNFQVANIAATLQLARMVLFTAQDATVEQKCATAQELLHGFSKVPIFYLRAISSPLLHHLAGIGAILGSVMECSLSETSYLQVRAVLLNMADLLAGLEVGLTQTAGASQRIRTLLSRIDEYMQSQRGPAYPPRLPKPTTTTEQQDIVAIPQESNWATSPTWMSGMVGDPPQEELQFQVPPELLEDYWPWSFDMDIGLGGFQFQNFDSG